MTSKNPKNISCNSFFKKDHKLIAKKVIFMTLKIMFKWSCYEIYKIYVQYMKNICGKFISVFISKNPKKHILCNRFIKKDFKLIAKKLCFWPLKQCLSGCVMQFIKFVSNTLKISVANLFHSFYIKESPKIYLVTVSSRRTSN